MKRETLESIVKDLKAKPTKFSGKEGVYYAPWSDDIFVVSNRKKNPCGTYTYNVEMLNFSFRDIPLVTFGFNVYLGEL